MINLGNNETVSLQQLVETIEKVFQLPAHIERLEAQKGDVPITYADTRKVKSILDFKPQTKLKDGIKKFKNWYDSINKIE